MRTVAITCINALLEYITMAALLEYLDLLQIQAAQNRSYGCSTKQGWNLWCHGDMVPCMVLDDFSATGVQ